MEIMVNNTAPVEIEIGATGLEAVAQELRMLLATPRGSVPLDRDFGVSWDAIDQSMPAAKQVVIAEIASAIERNIPRAKFKSISFPNPGNTVAADGQLPVAVTVEIRQEYMDEFRQA